MLPCAKTSFPDKRPDKRKSNSEDGSICSRLGKNYFEMSKNCKQKFRMYVSTF
jgi:hypothetical protein